MALKLKPRLCVLCDRVEIHDETGTYDAVNNTTGYGGVNPDFGDLIPYTVDIFIPGATDAVMTYDLLASPPSPDADGHYTWTIPLAELQAAGYTLDYLVSGWWKASFSAGDDGSVNGGVPITRDIDVFAFGDIETRLSKARCESDCECEETCHEDRWIDLIGAKLAFQCRHYAKAQAIVEKLYRDVPKPCGCT